MNSTITLKANSVFPLIRNSIQIPAKGIFERSALRLAQGGRPPAAEPQKQPEPKAAIVAGKEETSEPAMKAGIDFALVKGGEKKKAAPEVKNIDIEGINPAAVSLFRQQAVNMLKSFLHSIEKEFEAIQNAPAKKPASIPQKSSQLERNLDHLSLVSYDDLDLQIMVNHTEAALLGYNQDPLTLLCMRFEHILKYEILATRLPIGPIAMGRALLEAVVPLDISLDDKKRLLLLLLSELEVAYPVMIEQANRICIQQNILPSLTEEDSRVRRKREQTRELAKEKRDKLFGITEEKKGDTVAVSAEISRFISNVQIPKGAEHHFVKGDANAPVISKKELAAKIDLIKTVQPKVEENGVYLAPDTSSESLADLLNTKAELSKVGLDAQKSNTIGIMSLLFEQLLANENIPGPIKALLQQLRAPLLKAAVQDEMFFGDADNPAQKFFNEIAKASISWTPSKHPQSDTLYQKMSALVAKVNSGFDDDYLIFDDAIGDLDEFQETENKRSAKIEGRMVETETAQARQKSAKEVSIAHVEEKLSDKSIPADVRLFFATTWQQVLFFIFNKTHSVTSEEWLDAIEVENSLLANLSGSEEDEVDLFLDILKEKLADCSIQPLDIKKQTTMLHRVMLNKNEIRPETIERIKGIQPQSVTKIVAPPSVIEAGDKVVETILDKLLIGAWIQKNRVSPIVKVKLAAYIKFNDSYVLVQRNGAKDSTFTRTELVKKIQSKEFSIIENQLLFDSALESVIGGIR
jgi:thiamine phosphate synthase YjbQ (UPF0047 family)